MEDLKVVSTNRPTATDLHQESVVQFKIDKCGLIFSYFFRLILIIEIAIYVMFVGFISAICYEEERANKSKYTLWIALAVVAIVTVKTLPSQICGWIGVNRYNLGCLYIYLALELVSLLTFVVGVNAFGVVSSISLIPSIILIHSVREAAKLE